MKLDSLLIHGGVDGDEHTGAVNVPIYQTSTYKQSSLGVTKGYEYSRTGNPTREALEKLIAELEVGKRGFAFASGMAALSAVLMLFKKGDKILISDNVYGGTYRILDKVYSQFDLKYESVNTADIQDVESHIDEKTKAILIETPTNPLMSITDINTISTLAKNKGILTIVDNTFMTPYFQQPIALGADIVVHSATKYLGGHSDLIAGLAVVNTEELGEKLHFIQNATGGVLNPFDSWLLIRGIKTLGVRLQRHNENAIYISEYLNKHEAVEKVYYPGFKEHPGHDIHVKQASGFGGMLSFVLKTNYNIKKFYEALKVITLGESLGGVESLACHPASMTHASIPYEVRQKVGIVDNLIRLSIGLEDKEDILGDIENALKEAKN
jgi:cystathionine beta-lyase